MQKMIIRVLCLLAVLMIGLVYLNRGEPSDLSSVKVKSIQLNGERADLVEAAMALTMKRLGARWTLEGDIYSGRVIWEGRYNLIVELDKPDKIVVHVQASDKYGDSYSDLALSAAWKICREIKAGK